MQLRSPVPAGPGGSLRPDKSHRGPHQYQQRRVDPGAQEKEAADHQQDGHRAGGVARTQRTSGPLAATSTKAGRKMPTVAATAPETPASR
jgi:hypothetical protein